MPRSKIITGLKEAAKYSRGDKSRGKSTVIRTTKCGACENGEADDFGNICRLCGGSGFLIAVEQQTRDDA